MITAVRALFLVAAVGVCLAAYPATYVVPQDAEMIQKADDIVVATGIASFSTRTRAGAIVTISTLRIEQTLKGERSPGDHLVLTEPGGSLGDVARIIAGVPQYEPGVQYLVFTTTNADLEPVTLGMSLGQFRLVREAGRKLAVRQEIHGFDQNLAPHGERARDAERFTAWIRDTVAQRGTAADYFVKPAVERQIATEWEISADAFSRSSYLMQLEGIGFRWRTAVASWVHAGTQHGAGNGEAAIGLAFSQWNSTGVIRYTHLGADPTALGGLATADGRNTILFNDPNDEIQNGNGVAGVGGVTSASRKFVDDEGETFWLAAEADVVMANSSFSQSCLDAVVIHEAGHTLGFRHSNIPPSGTVCGTTAECTSKAVMNSSVNCATGGTLQGWDQNAAARTYGGTATTPQPVRRRTTRH